MTDSLEGSYHAFTLKENTEMLLEILEDSIKKKSARHWLGLRGPDAYTSGELGALRTVRDYLKPALAHSLLERA